MKRCWCCGLVLLLGAAAARGEELKGSVTSVDAKNNKLTVKVGDKTQAWTVIKDATIVSRSDGSKKAAAAITPLAGGLSAIKAGAAVEFRTEEQDGKNVITSLKVDAVAKPAEEAKPAKKLTPAEKKALKKKKQAKAEQAGRRNKKKLKQIPAGQQTAT